MGDGRYIYRCVMGDRWMVGGEWLVGGEWVHGMSVECGCKGMREVLTEGGGVLLTELERDCVEDGRGISVMGRGPKNGIL